MNNTTKQAQTDFEMNELFDTINAENMPQAYISLMSEKWQKKAEEAKKEAAKQWQLFD